LAACCAAAALVGVRASGAEEGAPAPAPSATEEATAPAPPASAEAAPTSILPEAPPEAPPPPPRHRGIVLESGLGALGFMGQFRHIAPTAPWMYSQLGFEPASFLMILGYGELAFTDTSESQDESHRKAFPIFGFGGGMRVTFHVTERVAVFGQGNVGAMKADVPAGTLSYLGYRSAESLGLSLGVRGGVEWYQIDRHLALGLGVGFRDAQGFARSIGGDTPFMIDANAAIRYTF